MIIHCEQCTTTYHLDEKLLEPFGSKVRCTRCGHIFWAEPPSFSDAQPFSDTRPFSESLSKPEPALILDEEEEAALQIRPPRKALRVLGIIILLALLALAARFLYVQYLHPNWDFKDVFSNVFFLPVDPEGNQKISLINIKKYFKENPKIGRFFIIEGEIKNGYPDPRRKIKIRGSLRTAENRVAVSREIYSGWTFTAEELDSLSLEEINKLILTQTERFSPNLQILPGKSLPFMILFPPLPPGSTQVSIEVVSSQKAQSPSTP
ncbi:MAG: zinc-ribbon domain-containing protein [Deltaproteobacteria bacterium]|nr:zinc-ribbon domain-containing protein [Deltaproteobacteria bacterium]